MIRTVADSDSTWTDLPWKFEAGTSQIAEAIGLGAAVDWIQAIGIERIRAHEEALVSELVSRLTSEVPELEIHGPPPGEERGRARVVQPATAPIRMTSARSSGVRESACAPVTTVRSR